MGSKFAYLFPGQGAQYVGMGRDFFERFSIARHTFEEADEILGRFFSHLIFEGPQQELTLTKNSQLAIFITSIAMWRVFQEQFPDIQPSFCAGLSLGEYAALVVARRISFTECLKLVEARGLFMHEACSCYPGTMRVVLGLEALAVEQALGADCGVWIANLNCPGQVVIAGYEAEMQQAADRLKEHGAKRVLPLDVAGAFHSPLMRQAQERLSPLIEQAHFKQDSIQIVMNAVGGFVSALEDLQSALIRQVTSPVLWEKGIRYIESSGVDFYIEIGCGKTLSGMNRKIEVSAPTVSIETVSDLESVYHSLSQPQGV